MKSFIVFISGCLIFALSVLFATNVVWGLGDIQVGLLRRLGGWFIICLGALAYSGMTLTK